MYSNVCIELGEMEECHENILGVNDKETIVFY